MKNHKFAYIVWMVANFIAYATLTLVFRSISSTGYKTIIVGVSGNLYLYAFSFSLYIYCIACLWDTLQNHIALSDEINERNTHKNLFVSLADGISELIISQALLACFVLTLWYWMIRVVVLVFGWLRYGEWVQYSSCDAIQSFCYFDGSFVGINIIANWIGKNDFGLLLTIVCFTLGFLFKQHPKAQ